MIVENRQSQMTMEDWERLHDQFINDRIINSIDKSLADIQMFSPLYGIIGPLGFQIVSDPATFELVGKLEREKAAHIKEHYSSLFIPQCQ